SLCSMSPAKLAEPGGRFLTTWTSASAALLSVVPTSPRIKNFRRGRSRANGTRSALNSEPAMTDDIVARLREMPKSLDDAMRKMDKAADTIEFERALRAQAEQERTDMMWQRR